FIDHDYAIRNGIDDRTQPLLAFLALGDVAHDPDKDAFSRNLRLGHGQVHRKNPTVSPPTGNIPADADDLSLSGSNIIGDIAVMLRGIGFRHQHLYVAAD